MRTTLRAVAVLIALLLSALLCYAQSAVDRLPMSDRVVSYRIDVALDAASKMLTGHETLTWRNPSGDNVSELQFHLYMNCFKNTETTVMKEVGGVLRGNMLSGKEWGWITVKRMAVTGGEDLTSRMEFIQPDDGNVNDETVLRVPLKKPVGAHQAITLQIDFEAQLPKLVRRTGLASHE
jgi:hypothetical protein